MIAKGELGYIPAKHIVSALPEEGERPSSTHKKITVDGWDRDLTFKTTLLFGNLRVTKEELDDWYAWFYGEDIAGRKPPPSDTTLLFAERNAWRKIHEMVHQGTTLSEALKNIRGDFLFWQREVYEHLNRAPEKGKSKSKAPKVWQTQWEKPKKGGKGSWPSGPTRRARAARGSPPTPPDSMAVPLGFQESQNRAYCRDHHLHNKCSGSCGRSHNCPVRKDGWVPRIEACVTGMPTPRQVTCWSPLGSQATSARVHTAGNPTRATAEGRQSGGGQDGLRSEGATGPATPSTEEEERTQSGHSRRAETLSPTPTREEPAERPRGEDPPGKGRSQGGQQAQGQIRQKDTRNFLGGGKPHLPMDAGHPGKTEAQTKVDATSGAGVVKAVPHPAVEG